MARRRAFAGRRASGRTSPQWAYAASTSLAAGALAANTKVLAAFLVPTAGLDVTILRTHLRVWVVSDVAAVEEQVGAVGIIKVTNAARTAGIASIPDPVTAGSDGGWLVHQPIWQASSKISAAPIGVAYEIDSKAMRKLPTGYELALVFANSSPTFALEFGYAWRTLAKQTES